MTINNLFSFKQNSSVRLCKAALPSGKYVKLISTIQASAVGRMEGSVIYYWLEGLPIIASARKCVFYEIKFGRFTYFF